MLICFYCVSFAVLTGPIRACDLRWRQNEEQNGAQVDEQVFPGLHDFPYIHPKIRFPPRSVPLFKIRFPPRSVPLP